MVDPEPGVLVRAVGLCQLGTPVVAAPGPRVAEPHLRDEVERRGVRAVVGGLVDEAEVGGVDLGVGGDDVEEPVVGEDAGVGEFELVLVLAA
ncbi:MAG TPA: hypothetical protein VHO26_12630 [Propionibacteriaceae bacterium]|nr:hypothetical protein [Propionibacteriaceae bacterium]